MKATDLSDLILTLIILGFFVFGSLGGLFKFCRLAGLTALSILGGMSVGMRLILMREGLLLRPIALNWIIIVVCAVVGSVVTLLRQRIGVVRVTFWNLPRRRHLIGFTTGSFLHVHRNVPPLTWH